MGLKILKGNRVIVMFILLILSSLHFNNAYGQSDSLQKVLDKAGSDTAKVRILILAAQKESTTDPERVAEYASMALNLSRKINYPLGIGKSYYWMGCAAYTNQTLDKSHNYFLKAATIFDSLHDYKMLARANKGIGNVMEVEHGYKNAVEYYNKAKAGFMSIKDTTQAIYTDVAIVGDLAAMNLLDSSIKYSLHTVLPIARKYKNDVIISQLLTNIGIAYSASGNDKKALEYQLEALPYFEKANNVSNFAIAYQGISETYFGLKDIKNAEKYALLSDSLYGKIKSVRGTADMSAPFRVIINT